MYTVLLIIHGSYPFKLSFDLIFNMWSPEIQTSFQWNKLVYIQPIRIIYILSLQILLSYMAAICSILLTAIASTRSDMYGTVHETHTIVENAKISLKFCSMLACT